MIATDLAARLEALTPEFFGVASCAIRGEKYPVFAEEAVAVSNAVGPRQQEFFAGRTAARRAMRRARLNEALVLTGDDRAPIWPEGMVGSISHTGDLAAAVVARANDVVAVGLDIEANEGLEQGLWAEILSPNERDWVLAAPVDAQARRAKLVFSVKECAYKCQYPLTRQLFGFETLAVTFAPEGGRFEARFMRNVGSFTSGDVINGRYHCDEALIIAVAYILRKST